MTFIHQDQERIGAVEDAGHIVDLERAYAGYLREAEGISHADQLAAVLGREMCKFLQGGEKVWTPAQKARTYANTKHNKANGEITFDRQQVRLIAPVPRPGALVSAGKNFSDHVAEMASKKGPGSRGLSQAPRHGDRPRGRYPYPPEVKNLDYEVELAVIIGKPCVDVSEEEALDYVAGMPLSTISAPGTSFRSENKTGIHLMGKSFPGFAPMGPISSRRRRFPIRRT